MDLLLDSLVATLFCFSGETSLLEQSVQMCCQPLCYCTCCYIKVLYGQSLILRFFYYMCTAISVLISEFTYFYVVCCQLIQ